MASLSCTCIRSLFVRENVNDDINKNDVSLGHAIEAYWGYRAVFGNTRFAFGEKKKL